LVEIKRNYENIDNFRLQMTQMNTQYEETITSDDNYIKHTQWLFTKLYEKDYIKDGEVDYCSCETVLAREQVKNGVCERCDNMVIKHLINGISK
jgi:leucyl-tRNA synthetase